MVVILLSVSISLALPENDNEIAIFARIRRTISGNRDVTRILLLGGPSQVLGGPVGIGGP